MSFVSNQEAVIQKGDSVKVMSHPGVGTVVKADAKEVWVEFDDFAFPFPIEEVLKVNEDDSVERLKVKETSSTEDIFFSESPGEIPMRPDVDLTKHRSRKGIPVVDLHLEHLVRREGNLKAGEKLNIQLEHLKGAISTAYRKKVSEIIIVHGVGSGKLKQEVQNYLEGLYQVDFWDASFKEFGQGAVHIKIYRNRKKTRQ